MLYICNVIYNRRTMHFSKTDLDIILKYVLEHGLKQKLSEFPEPDTITGKEIMPIIQEEENKVLELNRVIEIPSVSEKFEEVDDKYAQQSNALDNKYRDITEALDERYANITNELYSMVASLQVGGIALSQQFGNRTDIGISQKTLTKALGNFWNEMGKITGKTYMDFTLTVTPSVIYKEGEATIVIKADCSESISNFDSIKVYVDNVLIAESSDLEVFTVQHTISQTSNVKAVGIVLGKTITKEQQIIKEVPFFMGSGSVYTDVLNEECRKQIVGTLEGDYDAVIKHSGEYLFIVIPISRREEFRRCRLDMNGFEIPLDTSETSDYIICKSLNTYKAGTYNIDIDINS